MNRDDAVKENNKARRKIGSRGLESFAEAYFKEYLKYKPSETHKELYKLADDMFINRSRRIVVAAPRNFGKTTLFGTILMAYSLCFCKERYIVVCSNTATLAQDKVDDVRKALIGNDPIRRDFPELFDQNGKIPILSKERIETANGIKIEAFGYQQRMRGKKYGAERPSLVLIDDLDSEVNAGSVEQKNKLKDWFSGALLKLGDEKTNYIMVGNFFHRFSVIGDLCSDKKELDWEKHVYQAVESFPERMDLWTECWRIYVGTVEYKGKSGEAAARIFFQNNKEAMVKRSQLLWPERYDLFNLMMDFHNNPASFNAEMQNQPREALGSAFDPTSFRFWNPDYKNLAEIKDYIREKGVFYAACDPSTGKQGMQGDNSAIVIIGVKDKIAYVLHADIRRRNMSELIQDILGYGKQYTFRSFGIEVTGGQEYFYQTLIEKAREAGVKINFKPINNSGDKRSRIETLASDLRTHTIQLCSEHIQLREEFASFPYGKHDDGLDALEMAYRIYLENKNMDAEQIHRLFEKLRQPKETTDTSPHQILINAMYAKFHPGSTPKRIV